MKRLFFIGKFNTSFKDISNYLEKYFHVLMCVDNLEMMKGLLKINQPDLVVISLIGMGEESREIFNELKNNYSCIPVICMGTEGEQEQFQEYYRVSQFKPLISPDKYDEILEYIYSVLGVKGDSDKGSDDNKRVGRKTVLLVDDSAMLLRTMNDMLKQKYDVQIATSGMKALALIAKKRPDIIFLDYEMPVCDGKMTMKMIREQEGGEDIPIVFLTGVKDKQHIEDVLKLKPAGYLLKPASADVIYNILDNIFMKQEPN